MHMTLNIKRHINFLILFHNLLKKLKCHIIFLKCHIIFLKIKRHIIFLYDIFFFLYDIFCSYTTYFFLIRHMSFSILNNICMLWNFYYMSFNFSNNMYMLGAHFIYVTLSKHPTTWTCFDFYPQYS